MLEYTAITGVIYKKKQGAGPALSKFNNHHQATTATTATTAYQEQRLS
jgi:hypothetical protein